MWHVSSHSGVATLRTAVHLLLTYLLIIHLVKLAKICTFSLLPVLADLVHKNIINNNFRREQQMFGGRGAEAGWGGGGQVF